MIVSAQGPSETDMWSGLDTGVHVIMYTVDTQDCMQEQELGPGDQIVQGDHLNPFQVCLCL